MGLLNGHADPTPKDLRLAEFSLQPDGTLLCPADHPLYPQERRPERDGSVRVLYAARIGHCRRCPLRAQCQENSTTSKPRRVSAVFWPLTSTTSPPDQPLPEQPVPSRPVLWGDWERCHLRRHWFSLLRTQTVLEGGVARMHARIFVENGQYMLEDENSANFTFLNRQRLAPKTPTPLNHNDEIKLGRVLLRFLKG
jgi:hypothetical protein